MISPSSSEFMSNKMKININSINNKFDEPIFKAYSSVASHAIDRCIDEIKKLEPTCGLSYKKEVEGFICSIFCSLMNSVNNLKVQQVFDALRMTFTHYASGGLYQLYTQQENGEWYPEIILTDILIPNDISSLDEIITLYRGCNKSEYENKCFRQAWTTSLDVARSFAYEKYLGYDGFNIEDRVVLVTRYSRDHVLFSNQSVEYEVVINTNMLGDVRLHV